MRFNFQPPTQESKEAYLINPNNPQLEAESREVEAAAHSLGVRVVLAKVSTGDEIGLAVASLMEQKVGAMLSAADILFVVHAEMLIALAHRHALPTIYIAPGWVRAGGLISYGGDDTEAYGIVGTYVGRILKSEKPSRLAGTAYDAGRDGRQAQDGQGARTDDSTAAARPRRRGDRMKRREFIAGLDAAAWPLATRAQQSDRLRRIGVLMPCDENDPAPKTYVYAFTQALADLGWTDGRNVLDGLSVGRR